MVGEYKCAFLDEEFSEKSNTMDKMTVLWRIEGVTGDREREFYHYQGLLSKSYKRSQIRYHHVDFHSQKFSYTLIVHHHYFIHS